MTLNAILHSSRAFIYLYNQAGHGRLIPIKDGAEVKLVGYNPSTPGSYSVFDPDMLTSTAHCFEDSLQIDFASNSPVLDSDGVTYNGAF